MKSKSWQLLLIVAIVDQAFLMLCFDSFRHSLPTLYILTVLITKLSGDLLSRFVFKFPGYQWVYIRDYVLHDFIISLGYYVIFALMWLAALVVANPALFAPGSEVTYAASSVIYKVLSSSLLPTLFYAYFHSRKTEVPKTSKKRMRKKL